MDLSVIVPCRNEAATLGEQLDALAAQQWDGDWEVMVVDNGSTDETVTIATTHPGLAGRLRVVHAPDVTGVAAVRRRGVEASTARAVVFCDGDDIVGPGWVASLGDALRTHEFVTGQVEVDRLNTPGLAASRGRRRLGQAPKYGTHTILSGGNGGMTRAAWDRFDGFDEQFRGLEDIELSLRIAAAGGQIEFVPDAVLHYRYRSGARALWKQGRFYGASQIALARRCRVLGLHPPTSHAWKSWAWLALNAPLSWLPQRRLAWLWVLACRVGAASTVVRYRVRRLGFLALLAWSRRPILPHRTPTRAPLHLVSITFDNPTLTEAQLMMLRDCLVDDHTVTVADNSRTRAGAAAIRDVCRRMGVEYVRLHRNPYTGRDPSRSHAEALRAAARHLRRLRSVEVLGFLDHDIFPTTGTSVMSHMADHDAYGTRTAGRDCWYLWPGLLFVRPEVWPLRSLDFAPVHGRGDTGCALYFTCFQHHPEGRIAFANSHQEPLRLDDRELLLEWHDTWIHTLNGSYWKSAARKEDLVIEALQGFGLRTDSSAS